jgi:hypothetical protein
MSHPKFFRVEQHGDTLVFSAVGSMGSLVEDDVRDEWDALLTQLDTHHARNAVIDLGALDYFGSIMLRRGKLAICRVSEVGKEILQTAKFHTIWPIVGTRDEALAAVGATAAP